MTIEINSLYHVSVVVSALLGILLLFSWWRDRTVPSLAWWGCAMLFVSAGFALVAARGTIHHVLSIVVANVLLLFGGGLIWTGARIFDGRRPHRLILAAGPVIWVIACLVPAFYGSIVARGLFISVVAGGYTLLAAYEFWTGRAEPLVTRWPATLLLTAHGLLFVLRVIPIAVVPIQEGLPGQSSRWYTILHYEIVLYLIALSFMFLAMAKERSTRRLVTPDLSRSPSPIRP